MQALSLLFKKGIINDLIYRDISNSLKSQEYLYLEDGLKKYGINDVILKDIRSEIFSIEKFSQDIKVDKTLLSYINEDVCRKYFIIPLEDSIIGILDPEADGVMNKIQDTILKNNLNCKLEIISKTEYEISLNLLMSGDFKSENNQVKDVNLQNEQNDKIEDIENLDFVMSDVKKVLSDMDKKQVDDISDDRVDLEKYKDSLSEVTVERLINSILYDAIDEGASDIHLENTGEKSRFRYREDGVLRQKLEMDSRMHQSFVARIKILSDMKLDEKRKPQDGRFSVKIKNGEVTHKIDFRVSTMPAYYGEKVVMRILDSYRGIRKLETVGFSEVHLNQIRKALEKPYGMIIISGPTGSGKTTTLYSMLNELDREKRNVVSLEDPIEYNVPNMNQSQIFPEIGYTFATGLRSILRQDPDVIMVGEIRDKETAELAIQAALTGHLVFSTIHTNNSVGVITRLMDMGVDPYLIAPTVVLSIAQRLAPMIHPGCASKIEMTPAITNILTKEFEDLDDRYKSNINFAGSFYEALPNEVSMTGTKGRMPVLEILEVDNDIQNAILKKMNEEEIYAIARAKGMLTMREDAMIKSMAGKIPFVEIASL